VPILRGKLNAVSLDKSWTLPEIDDDVANYATRATHKLRLFMCFAEKCIRALYPGGVKRNARLREAID